MKKRLKYWFIRLYYRMFKRKKLLRMYTDADPYPGDVYQLPYGRILYLGKNLWIALSLLFVIFMLAGCFQPPCPTYEDRFRNEILLYLQQREYFRKQNKKLKCKNREEYNDRVKVHATDYYVSDSGIVVGSSVLYFPPGSDKLTSAGK